MKLRFYSIPNGPQFAHRMIMLNEWLELMPHNDAPKPNWLDEHIRQNSPVTNITWAEAEEFINKLNAAEGLSGEEVYRLPTPYDVAAARGTQDGRDYSGKWVKPRYESDKDEDLCPGIRLFKGVKLLKAEEYHPYSTKHWD